MKIKSGKIKDNLVVELLNTFSDKELKQFRRFVDCDYFNTDQYVIGLLDSLRDKVLKNTLNIATQEQVFKDVFATKAIPVEGLDKQQRSLLHAKMSDLHRLAKRFLTIEALDENPAYKQGLLYKKMLERKQLDALKRQLNKDEKQLAQEGQKGIEYYHFSYEVAIAKMHYLHRKGRLVKEDNLPDLMKNLDFFYLFHRLKWYSTGLSLSRVSDSKKYNFEITKTIALLLEIPQYAGHPLLQLYQASIQLMETNENKYYIQLLELLDQYFTFVPRQNLQDFYATASNFCLHQIRLGNIDYNRSLYELYKIMDSKNLLIQGDFIPIGRLKNIVSLNCHVGDFEWAMEFVNKYQYAVKKDIQESVWHFNMGAIAFYQKNYQKAISHFIRVEKVDTAYDVNCRMMLIKSHYQLDEEYDERSMKIFRSAVQFIKNNKSLSVAHRKGFTNFITILINLYRVRHFVGKMTTDSIQKKLTKMDLISDKRWLLEKLEEL